MRKDLFRTLFSRMLTTYLTVILSLLLLMGITVSSMFKNQYIREEEETLRREGEKINTILIEEYFDPQKKQSAIDKLTTVARQYNALIQVIDSRGNPHSFSFMDETLQDQKWDLCIEAGNTLLNEEDQALWNLPGINIWPAIPSFRIGERLQQWEEPPGDARLLTAEGELVWNVFRDVSDMPILTLARAMVRDGTADGVVLLHFDMSSVNASITQVYLDVLLTAFVAVVAAVLAVFYLTTRITKPITDMNATVRRYSKGEFNLRLQDDGADEVAQLAKTFNTMADELNDLEHTRRSFVANVSHELRSPLTSMRGFLEAIQDGTVPKEEEEKYLDIVIGETRRMTDMVNDLLDLARMESGHQAPKKEQFDVNELTRRTLITFEPRINEKKLEVEADLLQPHCWVEADSAQIAQVLRNLIDNAIKFSPDGGKLTITTRNFDRYKAIVSVKDCGCGIPQEDLPHIFERFYKVEKAHTPSKKSGTGLGLAIVKRIIDQHDQDIQVTSGENGTCFTFTLRRVQDYGRTHRANESGTKHDTGRKTAEGEQQ